MFELRSQPLLSSRKFLVRQVVYLLIALGIIAGVIGDGHIGLSSSREAILGRFIIERSHDPGRYGPGERAQHHRW